MAKHVFSRAQYLDILNESLKNHHAWRPGMAFVFEPPGASARTAKGITCTGPDDPATLAVYDEIERVAAGLIEVRG